MATCWDMYNKERNYVLKIWASSQFFLNVKKKKKKQGGRESPVLIASLWNSVLFFKPNEVRFPQVFWFITCSFWPVCFACLLFWHSVNITLEMLSLSESVFLPFHEWVCGRSDCACECDTQVKTHFPFLVLCLQIEETIFVGLPSCWIGVWKLRVSQLVTEISATVSAVNVEPLRVGEVMPFGSISNVAFKSGLPDQVRGPLRCFWVRSDTRGSQSIRSK